MSIVSKVRAKARQEFVRCLSNDYFDFLDERGYLDRDLYELYIDPVYDDDHDEQIGCLYTCYFDDKREEFSDISDAESYSMSYFYDFCVSLVLKSLYSLCKDGIFNDFTFSVFDFFRGSGEVFSSTSFEDIFDWLKVIPGHILKFTFNFYTPYDYASYFFRDDCQWKSMLSVFRHYLVLEEGFDLVDLCDFDFVFDFLRLQEKLTCYEVRLSTFTGYNTFRIHVYHKKED